MFGDELELNLDCVRRKKKNKFELLILGSAHLQPYVAHRLQGWNTQCLCGY